MSRATTQMEAGRAEACGARRSTGVRRSFMAEERTKGQGSATSLQGWAYASRSLWTGGSIAGHATRSWTVSGSAGPRRSGSSPRRGATGVSLRFHNGGYYGLGSSPSVSSIQRTARKQRGSGLQARTQSQAGSRLRVSLPSGDETGTLSS